MENILQTKNLTKIFDSKTPAEVKAVGNVDFELKPGEIVMIMGPSSFSKTTLLTMLGGLLKPSSGSIALDDQQLQNLNQNQLTYLRRQKIGFIFQSFNLLENLTALENVLIGGFAIAKRRQKTRDLLVKLGLKDRLNAKPKSLSGGERQRVAIARALINDPVLILADEPTANLDKTIGHEVMMLLCSIDCDQGKSIVIVSHDERIKDVAPPKQFSAHPKTVSVGRLVANRVNEIS